MAILLCAVSYSTAIGAAPLPAGCGNGARARAAGFDATALCAVLADFAASHDNFHGLVIERHGAVVAQVYRDGKDASDYSLFARTTHFDATRRHDMRSISKSVTGLLWGIADGQGGMPSLATPVRDVLPVYRQPGNDARAPITLEHLFNMRSGLAWNEASTYRWDNDELGPR